MSEFDSNLNREMKMGNFKDCFTSLEEMMKISLNISKWHPLHSTTFWRLSGRNFGNIQSFWYVFATGKIYFLCNTSFHNFLFSSLLQYCLLFGFHSEFVSNYSRKFSQFIITDFARIPSTTFSCIFWCNGLK